MTGELISSGFTIDAGRRVLNTMLSGSSSTLSVSGVSFSNIHVNSTLTASTINADSISLSGTNLYSIFTPIGGGSSSLTANNISFSGYLQTISVTANANAISRLKSRSVGTTNATPQTIPITAIANDTTMGFVIYITARQTGGASGTVGDSAFFKVEVLTNVDSFGILNIIGTPAVTTIAASAAASTWSVTAGVSFLLLQVTGQANKNITWTANVEEICA